MFKKYFIHTLVCLGISQTLLAEGEVEFSPVLVGEPLDCYNVTSVYPYPGNFNPCNSWNLYASGEFLYWVASKDTVPNACAFLTYDNSQFNLKLQKVAYQPGFRVAIGLDLDSVILNLSYLRYHSHTTSHFTAGENGGLIFITNPVGMYAPLYNQPRLFFESLNSKHHIGLDVGLISLQHPVYFGKRIILNLGYGLLGLWHTDGWRFSTTALPTPPPLIAGGLTSNGLTISVKKSWAVGPNLSFAAIALLPWRFQLLSNLDLAVQYAEQNKLNTTTSYPDYANMGGLIPFGNFSMKLHEAVPHYQVWHSGDLGIGWGDYFWCDRYHFNLSLKYSWVLQHIFPLYNPASAFGADINMLHNVSVHGLTVSGRLDF